jgi:hypothetical protein
MISSTRTDIGCEPPAVGRQGEEELRLAILKPDRCGPHLAYSEDTGTTHPPRPRIVDPDRSVRPRNTLQRPLVRTWPAAEIRQPSIGV